MKVKLHSTLKIEYLKFILNRNAGDDFHYLKTLFRFLEINKVYEVYSMKFEEENIYFYIYSSNSILSYPMYIFEIVDHSIPQTWVYKSVLNEETYGYRFLYGYKDFLYNNYLMGLANDEEQVEEIQMRIVKKIENESKLFPILLNRKIHDKL